MLNIPRLRSWIGLQEPAERGVIVAGAVEVEPGFRVVSSARIAERVAAGGRAGDLIPERIIGIAVGDFACTVCQRSNIAEPVSMIVADV